MPANSKKSVARSLLLWLVLGGLGACKSPGRANLKTDFTQPLPQLAKQLRSLLLVSYRTARLAATIPAGLCKAVGPKAVAGLIKLPQGGISDASQIVISQISGEGLASAVIDPAALDVSAVNLSESQLFALEDEHLATLAPPGSEPGLSATSPVRGDPMTLVGLKGEAAHAPLLLTMTGIVDDVAATADAQREDLHGTFHYSSDAKPTWSIDFALGAMLFDRLGGWGGIIEHVAGNEYASAVVGSGLSAKGLLLASPAIARLVRKFTAVNGYDGRGEEGSDQSADSPDRADASDASDAANHQQSDDGGGIDAHGAAGKR